jgi:copper(I)-binding protein
MNPKHDTAPASTARRQLLRAAGALPLLGLGTRATACEYIIPTLRITHPWTRATGTDSTHAVLITQFDEVIEDDRLIGIETPVAKSAVLVTPDGVGPLDLRIPQGSTVALDEQGVHIRLLELAHPLQIGRSYPLTMIFERGGANLASLNVDYGPANFSTRFLRR